MKKILVFLSLITMSLCIYSAPQTEGDENLPSATTVLNALSESSSSDLIYYVGCNIEITTLPSLFYRIAGLFSTYSEGFKGSSYNSQTHQFYYAYVNGYYLYYFVYDADYSDNADQVVYGLMQLATEYQLSLSSVGSVLP